MSRRTLTVTEPLILALDVDYRETHALVAGVWFRGWTAQTPEHEATAVIHEIADYEPGEFYRRELPCLLTLLPLGPTPDLIVVDGYVWLGNHKPGLGAKLAEALENRIPVVGIAKTRFASCTESVAVCRGGSQSPLYVTTTGIDLSEMPTNLQSMTGEFRLPTMLKRVDTLARTTTGRDTYESSEIVG